MLKFYCAKCGKIIEAGHTKLGKFIYHFTCAPERSEAFVEHAKPMNKGTPAPESTNRLAKELQARTSMVNSANLRIVK